MTRPVAPANESPLLIGRREVAELLGISTKTLDRLSRSNPSFPRPVLGGHRHGQSRWRRAEVLAFLGGGPAAPAPDVMRRILDAAIEAAADDPIVREWFVALRDRGESASSADQADQHSEPIDEGK